jgi:hypothetical protein
MSKTRIDRVLSDKLEALIARYPSLRKAANANGISAGYLSHARLGNRRPGRKLLRVLGLTERKIYEKKP